MINFSDCDILALQSKNNLLGTDIFRLNNTTSLTIDGWVLDLTNMQNVSGILSGVENLITSSQDFQPIILNNINFGSGRVLGWTFDAGTWVRSTRYSCQIEVYNSGNLYNLSGSYYSGLQPIFNNPNTQTPLIRNLDESFDFSLTREGVYSYSHQCSVSFYSGIGTNPLQLAINVASGLIYSTPPFGFINARYSGFYQNNSGKKTYVENYNLTTNEVSITENFSTLPPSGFYGVQFKQSCQTSEDGITNVTENTSIQGLVAPIYTSALSGLSIELPLSFNRCSGVYQFYAPTGLSLNSSPISKNQVLNPFDGKIDFTITFTDNINYQTGYFWSYTQTIEEGNDTIVNVSENGLVRGFGKLNTDEKFNRAISGYNIVQSGILPRASGLYLDFVGYNSPLNITNRDEIRSPYQGTIEYTRQYTDDPTFVNDPLVQKSNVVINQILPKHIFKTYNLINKGQIVQMGNNTELGEDDLQISLNVLRSGSYNRDYYLNYCKNIALNYKNQVPYSDIFYQNVNYTIDEINNNFNFNITYLGSSGKAYNDLNLGWN